MNEEMKNRTFLVVTVVFLLITVIVMGVVFALRGESKTKDIPKVSLKQVYASDYELSILNDAFLIGNYNGNLNVIVDNNGIEVVNNVDVSYDGFYMLSNGDYLFYDVSNNNLTTYVFNGSSLEHKYVYIVNDSLRPILFDNKLYGFTFVEDTKLHVLDINSSDDVVLNNLEIVGNYNSYLFVRNDENDIGVIDIKGNVLLHFGYDDVVGTSNGTFIVEKLNKKMLIDLNENVLLDNCRNILSFNGYYIVVNDKNKMALYDKDINMLTKYEMKYEEDLEVYTFDNDIVLAGSDGFYFFDDSVKYYEGRFFKYNNSYAYYLNNFIYLVDNSLNVIKEVSFVSDSKIVDVDVLPFALCFKIQTENGIEVKKYDYNFNIIKAKENIVYKGDNFFVYLNNKDDVDELIITDLSNIVIKSISGKNIIVNRGFVLIDGCFYKIVAE